MLIILKSSSMRDGHRNDSCWTSLIAEKKEERETDSPKLPQKQGVSHVAVQGNRISGNSPMWNPDLGKPSI